jgi:glycosyltransferase involved in cell wall biosynthesis
MNPPPIRVLQVNSLFIGGGVDNQTLELSAGLRDLGDDVTIAVAAGTRWEPRARELGVRVATFPARSPVKSAMIRCAVRLIREHRIQIIHAHQGRDYWPAILAARLAGRGTRVVVTRHLMTEPRRLSRLLLLRNANLIAVSRAVEKVVRAHLDGPPERIHQIYCGMDFSRFLTERTPEVWKYREQLGWPESAVVFAVVGSFHFPRGKGQLQFLEAAALLSREFPNARFAILGYGEMETLLKERIAALGLAGVANVFPFHDQIPLFMSALDVLVHPTTSTEAFPLVTLEALASGRPVIASRKDGIVEGFVDGEHGLFLPPGDVPALIEAMRTLARDPALRKRFGQAGSAHVRASFSRETLARRTRDLYLQLCSA